MLYIILIANMGKEKKTVTKTIKMGIYLHFNGNNFKLKKITILKSYSINKIIRIFCLI